MKRLFKILMVIILSFSIVACTTDASNIKVRTKFHKLILSKNKNEIFYGKWMIKKAVVYGKITEYGDEDIKKIIGKTITYERNKVVYGKHILKNPRYKVTNVSENDFFDENYLDLCKLGIKKKYVKEVDILTKSGEYWDDFGELFFIKNRNTIIVCYGGVFIELIRK